MIADDKGHRSLAFRIGRSLVEGRLEVASNGLEQLATGREFTLPPVTRFSRRPASVWGFASPRTFTTYARRVGYLESVLKVISAVGGGGPLKST